MDFFPPLWLKTYAQVKPYSSSPIVGVNTSEKHIWKHTARKTYIICVFGDAFVYFWSCYVFFWVALHHSPEVPQSPTPEIRQSHSPVEGQVVEISLFTTGLGYTQTVVGNGISEPSTVCLLSLGWEDIGRVNKHRMMIITYEFVNISQFYKWMTMMITMIMIRTCHCCKARYPKETCTTCWNYSDHKIQPNVGKSILYSVNFGFINVHYTNNNPAQKKISPMHQLAKNPHLLEMLFFPNMMTKGWFFKGSKEIHPLFPQGLRFWWIFPTSHLKPALMWN